MNLQRRQEIERYLEGSTEPGSEVENARQLLLQLSNTNWALLAARNTMWALLAWTVGWTCYRGLRYGLIWWCLRSLQASEQRAADSESCETIEETLEGPKWRILWLINVTTSYF
ncbi:uncharacterized protein K489DRAFT_168005 [Dissoconium aciculare CBS 342.82]|uniref:Uncharacterized protein n=1 Tax=Dissoconium aciculare CBS 342.82 TaxID=1314786 RepID=A0A6J3LPD4_9PEZI|nr:uncharacterized protein K489DRAFT_168005 [Dissoconium aciculare CBS 342.82]KAF1817745.1 hypothetical protein K489DRAFT_168005 [Dissoconium aciculare CBS 342.82]